MNLSKITFLLTSLTLLLVAMGNAIGGQAGMLVALAADCGMNLFSSWYSDKIILKLYPAREVSEPEHFAFRGCSVALPYQTETTLKESGQ